MFVLILFLLTICPTTFYASPADVVEMHYDSEDLVDIINNLAARKKVNVVLPTGAQAISAQVTLHLKEPVTLDAAWNMLQTLLDLAGYSLVPDGSMYVIVRVDRDMMREPLKLYIGVQPELLPDTDERIRYLYYLSNLKVPEGVDRGNPSELEIILSELLPTPTATPGVATTPAYRFDGTTNSLLIVEKARNIKSVMRIVQTLDTTVFQEKYEIIRLHHTSASVVEQLLKELISLPDSQLYKYHLKQKEPESAYFSRFTKIIAEPRSNSLILLGKPPALERLKDFIINEVDREPGAGESILHIYELQYLDAESFAKVLERIVTSQRGGNGQSTAGQAIASTERGFEDVIIRHDKPEVAATREATAGKGTGAIQYTAATETAGSGGNRLIIACRNDDWKVLKEFIEDMDKPRPQVIIEVLIADLSTDDTRLLGTITRNPAALPLPSGVNFQSAQIVPPFVGDVVPEANKVAVDLLALSNTTDSSKVIDQIAEQAALGFSAPTVVSFNDSVTGRTWSVLEVVNTFSSAKILSHPHIVARHNHQAIVSVGEQRLVRDQVSSGTVSPNINYKWIEAPLTVTITPRIFLKTTGSAKDATVNLNVTIDISQFQSSSLENNTIETRLINTNANVKSSDVLVLGGLIRTIDEEARSGTPILSKLPIIGYLFKNQTESVTDSNLTVFITPTVITPRGRAGLNRYTADYVNLTESYTQDAVSFDQLRDPITRWFFKPGIETHQEIEDFVSTDDRLSPKKLIQDQVEEDRAKATLPIHKVAVPTATEQLQQLLEHEDNPLTGL